jgi:hypothetical protein
MEYYCSNLRRYWKIKVADFCLAAARFMNILLFIVRWLDGCAIAHSLMTQSSASLGPFPLGSVNVLPFNGYP